MLEHQVRSSYQQISHKVYSLIEASANTASVVQSLKHADDRSFIITARIRLLHTLLK